MVLNRQHDVPIDFGEIRCFIGALQHELDLGRRTFNVCFVDDRQMARLNAAYRGKRRPTDVLSFPSGAGTKFENRKPKIENRKSELDSEDSKTRISNFEFRISNHEFRDFLGDIVISAPTAKRNAAAEGHPKIREIRWLIIHGVLHLLGYDHETDKGEMTAFEHELRERLRA